MAGASHRKKIEKFKKEFPEGRKKFAEAKKKAGIKGATSHKEMRKLLELN